MKLSRHALTVLTRQYRSVLLKCALINAGLFLAVAPAMAEVTVVTGIGSTKYNNMAVSSDGSTITGVVSINVNPTVATTATVYTKAETDTALGAKLDSSTAASTYETQAHAASTYETQGHAASTYETQAHATSTYETQAHAASTYLTQANASSTYLTQANASTTYATQTALAAKANAATTLAGYGITDAYTKAEVASAITTALANGTDPYQTASDVSAALSAYTKTADLAVVATSGAAADVSYDNTTSGLTAANVQAAIDENAGAIKDLTTNTSTGAISVASANIGATGLTSAGDIKTTGSGNIVSAGNISTTNGTISGKNGSFSGDLGVTGTATAGTLAVTNNATVGGTFGVTGVTTLGDDLQGTTATFTGKVNTVGLDAGSGNIKTTAKVDAGSLEVTGASVMKGGLTIESGSTPKVTLGTDGTIVATGKITSVGLDAGNGAITTTGTLSAGAATVTSLTSTGAISGTTGTFSGLLSANSGLTVTGASALNGDTTVKGTFGAGSDGTKFTVDANGNITKAGTIAATGLTTTTSTTALGGTGYTNTITGVTQLDATDGMKFGASGNVAKAIDNGASARTKTTANNDTTLATVASVLKSAENADFTAASGAFNVATGTINGAITSLDTAIGSRADWTKDDTNNALTVGTGLVANSSLADAVSQLNVNIGAAVTTANDLDATKTVNQNITAVDTALVGTQSALGAMIDQSTDAYVNTALQGNGFKKATTDLTDELSSYASNIATAFGGTFDATSGAWASGVTAKTATSYTGSVASTTVAGAMDTLAQVTYNIGTTAELTTTGVNGVNTAKTVNANIDALNIVIGDMTTLATDATTAGSATSGDALTNGTGVAPATVVAGLNNLSYTIGNIHNLKAEGSHLGANSNLASGTTVEQHLVSLDDAIGDRSFATTHYIAPHDDLSTAVTKLDSELHTLNHDVRKLRHDMDRGLASVSALSALIPNARGTGNTTVSVGTGYYNGHSSMALGGAHWFTDNLMVNVGAATSLDRTRNATYRAGLSYSF